MIPKTEKEVEAYAMLQELVGLRKKRHEKIYSASPGGSHETMPGYNEAVYQRELAKYLNLINEINFGL